MHPTIQNKATTHGHAKTNPTNQKKKTNPETTKNNQQKQKSNPENATNKSKKSKKQASSAAAQVNPYDKPLSVCERIDYKVKHFQFVDSTGPSKSSCVRRVIKDLKSGNVVADELPKIKNMVNSSIP